MLDRLRYRLAVFMQGRYGSDNFSRFLLFVWLIVIIISTIFRIPYFWIIELGFAVYIYFRMFSRNIPARYRENQAYLKIRNKVIGFFRYLPEKTRSLLPNSQYHIYRCPSCRQKIRIPKGKGNIIVRCPKCGTEFRKRS